MTKDNASRIAAGIDYALQQIALNGHCCIPDEPLVERTAKLLRVETATVREVLKQQIQKQNLAVEYVGSNTLIYPNYLYRAEQKVARKLLYLQKYADKLTVADPEKMVAEWEVRNDIDLAKAQREAMKAVLTHGIFVLTGGPGTGKTTVIRGMLEMLEWAGLDRLLGAPTGRAAKRLAEATGRKTMTVHRMLEAQGGMGDDGSSQFVKDADEQLEADAIILDEVSMMDIILMQHFIEAVPDGCHVILVGDVDQLPAVGPGSVLKDILRSRVIPSVRLTEVFRQNEESMIVLNAHAINEGRVPVCMPASDFQFIEIMDAAATADNIVRLCQNELPRQGWNPLIDVQVLSPMHRQECGVENLNKLLQAALNPKSPSKAEFMNTVQIFRLGDKVMQTKNNYSLKWNRINGYGDNEGVGIFNGDMGFIESISEENRTVTVVFDDERRIVYDNLYVEELELAYAITIHKSQGSEFKVIITPAFMGSAFLMNRNILYTGITRAKELVVVVGNQRALKYMVDNTNSMERYSSLKERILDIISDDKIKEE